MTDSDPTVIVTATAWKQGDDGVVVRLLARRVDDSTTESSVVNGIDAAVAFVRTALERILR